jgi:hypothetical protein
MMTEPTLVGITMRGVIIYQFTENLEKFGWDWLDVVGIIPQFLSNNGKPIAQQLADGYGYWRPMTEWSMDFDDLSIKYPGDPKLMPLVEMRLQSRVNEESDELIVYPQRVLVYKSGWVNIYNPGTKEFEVSRMD